MPRTLKIATIQMDAAPAPLEERLVRAADLISQAAKAEAQLVVLPELFNTGYQYTDANYQLAEPLDGVTATWMKAQAQQHQLHLSGSFMLLDEEDIYNTALLIAPDGRLWRYDKQYPWAMERAYFRGGDRITVANTDLGKLGMLICWDSAHPELWERYAGKVDAMLVMSCPPKMSSADLVFPDGLRVNMRELGGIFKSIYTEEEFFPGKDVDAQAAWLGVPVVTAVAGGKINTPLPLPWISFFSYFLLRPDLWWRVMDAVQLRLETGFDRQSKVINGQGEVLARVAAEGDGFTLAEVTLPDAQPQPTQAQPPMQTYPIVYLLCDMYAPALAVWQYRQRLRHHWGKHMARLDRQTRFWLIALGISIFLGWSLKIKVEK